MNRSSVRISTHVVERFIERVAPGIAFDDARKQIADILHAPRLNLALICLGFPDCKIVANGIAFCVRGRTVTTCYPLN